MTATKTDPRDIVLGRIKELPPLPVVVHELLAVMRDPDCSADDITRVLGTDQALASKILRLVNSSFYGMSGQVTTISRAVVILGHSALRSLATGLSVADSIGRALPPQRRQSFWRHALAAGAGAEIIARRAGLDDPEEAFVAGLLHDIGHLILMMALPAEHTVAYEAGELGDLDRERLATGLDHCRAGRYLLQHWKLPKPLLECVRLHHATETCANRELPLLTAVALADRLARIYEPTGETSRVTADAVDLMAALDLDPATVVNMLPDIAVRLNEARAFLQAAEIDPPAEADGAAAPSHRLVVLANDRCRAQWLEGLAVHYGHQVIGAREYLAAPTARSPELIIFDAESITDEQAARLAPALLASPAAILVPEGGDPGTVPAELRPSCRPLPLVFSAAELGL